jgi:subtilisin
MRIAIARVFGAGIAVALLMTTLDAAVEQLQVPATQRDKQIMAPRDARQLNNRVDLTDLFKQRPQIRVIVGLQTAEDAARSNDQTRQVEIAERQSRVLGRVQGLNISNIRRLRFHPFIAMTVDATALGALLADPEVTSVSEDGLIYPLLADTIAITRATSAWADGFRGSGQTVAVIDSGLDTAHPFFAGKVVDEACFSNPDVGATTLCPNGQFQQFGPGAGVPCSEMNIGCWHGTHVAGIAVGNYGRMTETSGGVAPSANVMSIQVFQKDCSTGVCQLVSTYSDIMLSLEHVYSLRNGFSIAAVNISIGGLNFTGTCDNEAPGVTAVINSLRAASIATVIASGNAASPNAISFPGCISSAISVGSTTKESGISSYSNSASFLTLLAPGQSIASAVPGGSYGVTSGTSMAAPHVAGAWATLKSAKPSATVSEVLAALNSGGQAMTDPRNGVTTPLIHIGDTATEFGALGVLLGRNAAANAEIIIDNAGAGVTDASGGRTFTGAWCAAPAGNQFGSDALVNCAGSSATYRWTPTIPNSGAWDVYVWWSASSSLSSKASIKVVGADSTITRLFDQRTGGGQWVLHGRYNFNTGEAGYVQVSSGSTNQVSADAVRFVAVPGAQLLPVVTVTAPDPSAGETGANPGSFSVSRTGSLATALTVQYTVNGTATPGADYTALTGTVTIPAGSAGASIMVNPIDDGAEEGIETVVVMLSAASNYAVGSSSSANVKITSDDVAAANPQPHSVRVTAKGRLLKKQ